MVRIKREYDPPTISFNRIPDKLKKLTSKAVSMVTPKAPWNKMFAPSRIPGLPKEMGRRKNWNNKQVYQKRQIVIHGDKEDLNTNCGSQPDQERNIRNRCQYAGAAQRSNVTTSEMF